MFLGVDIVRRLRRHPLGFVSCANDGFVKLWSSQGEEIWAVYAHPQQSDTDPFVYGVDVLPDGGVVSVGEDSTARVISPQGKVVQVIRHPAPLRDVCVLPNGDICTASGDGIARVWTLDKSRVIDDAKLAAYQEYIELAHSSGVSAIGSDQCHPETVLAHPGKRDGQVLVVDVRGKGPTVFQWSQAKNRWDEIGAAVGQRAKRPTLDGQEYDHIVQIDVGPPINHIPLGFNRDDDPQEVAEKFCERHKIEKIHVTDIKNHLLQFADPTARAKRLEEEGQKKSKMLRNIPCWKAESYYLDAKIEVAKMKSKALENNLELEAQKNPNAMNAKDLVVFEAICNMIKEPGSFHLDHLYTAEMETLIQSKLLNWPVQMVIPVLDALRVMMAHSGGVQIGESTDVRTQLLAYLEGGFQKIPSLLIMRGVSNWVAKRKKPVDSESKISEDIVQFLTRTCSSVAPAARDSNATMYTSYIYFVFK
jgi:phospholipase A-2-activating protein